MSYYGILKAELRVSIKTEGTVTSSSYLGGTHGYEMR